MYVVTLAEDRNRLTDPADPGGRFVEFGSTRQPMSSARDGEYWQFADGTDAGRTTTAVFNAETTTIPLTMIAVSRADLVQIRDVWRGRRLLLRTFEGDAWCVSYLEIAPRVNMRLTAWDIGVTFRVVS